MAGYGAGWLSLAASWATSLEMASCTGADAEYGVMTFVVFGLYTNTVFSQNIFLFSFGVFLPYFKKHFNAGSGEISTVNSIQMGVTFASGNFSLILMMIIQICVTFVSGDYILIRMILMIIKKLYGMTVVQMLGIFMKDNFRSNCQLDDQQVWVEDHHCYR